jgi:hypothetical protein
LQPAWGKNFELLDKDSILDISSERFLIDGWKSVREKRIGGGMTLIVGYVSPSARILSFCQIGDCAVSV